MKLNDLEKKFFTHVLKMELDKPLHATLELEGRNELYAMTVTPQLESYLEIQFNLTTQSTEEYHPFSDLLSASPSPVFQQASVERTPATLRICRPEGDYEIDVRILAAVSAREGILLLNSRTVIVQKSRLKYADLHLRNFKDFIGKSLVLFGEEWKITLVQLGVFGDRSGHTARIERKDGEEFEVDELEKVLNILQYFLTFVACNYQFPTAVIGYNSFEQVVCGRIGRFDSRNPLANWFNRIGTNPESVHLRNIFPAFWSKWQESPEEVAIIIDYYVSSATMERCGLLKDAVAKSYEALEFLAGQVLNNPNPKDYPQNIAKALKENSVPHRKLRESNNPQTLKMMRDLGISGSGFQLIYNVRNYITHPMEKGDPQTTKYLYREYFDTEYTPYLYVYDLSQFYLEYLFLKAFCGFAPPLYRSLIEKEELRFAYPRIQRYKQGDKEFTKIEF